jgi:hypothetical protein
MPVTCYVSPATSRHPYPEKLLNFIIAEVIRHHEKIADGSLTSNANPEP